MNILFVAQYKDPYAECYVGSHQTFVKTKGEALKFNTEQVLIDHVCLTFRLTEAEFQNMFDVRIYETNVEPIAVKADYAIQCRQRMLARHNPKILGIFTVTDLASLINIVIRIQVALSVVVLIASYFGYFGCK